MKAGVILLFLSDFCDPCGLQPTRFLCPWDYPGKNTGVGCHFLLLGIFPAQELNLHLLHCQVDSLPLSLQGSPGVILESNFYIINMCFIVFSFIYQLFFWGGGG